MWSIILAIHMHDSLQVGKIASQSRMEDKNDKESMTDKPAVCSTSDRK